MMSKLLFFRICGPNLNRTHGIGNMVKERKARRLVAHAIPSLSYTVGIKSAIICDVNLLIALRDGLTLHRKKRKYSPGYIPHQAVRS